MREGVRECLFVKRIARRSRALRGDLLKAYRDIEMLVCPMVLSGRGRQVAASAVCVRTAPWRADSNRGGPRGRGSKAILDEKPVPP